MVVSRIFFKQKKDHPEKWERRSIFFGVESSSGGVAPACLEQL